MVNYCKDCNIKVFRDAIRCITCSNIFRTGFKHSKKNKKRMSVSKLGENNPMWKGSDVMYSGLHLWIKRWKKKQNFCNICKEKKRTYGRSSDSLVLANISGNYLRDVEDFEWLCQKCHLRRDHSKSKEKLWQTNQ